MWSLLTNEKPDPDHVITLDQWEASIVRMASKGGADNETNANKLCFMSKCPLYLWFLTFLNNTRRGEKYNAGEIMNETFSYSLNKHHLTPDE